MDDCIVGAGSNEGAQGHNIGRNVAVLSGLGIQVPGMTLNRYCSSGLQAIAIAANQIASGCSEVIVAGGVESITLTLKSVNTDHLVNPLLQREVPGIYYPMGRPPRSSPVATASPARPRTPTPCRASSGWREPRRTGCSPTRSCDDHPLRGGGQGQRREAGARRSGRRDDCNRPDTTLEAWPR